MSLYKECNIPILSFHVLQLTILNVSDNITFKVVLTCALNFENIKDFVKVNLFSLRYTSYYCLTSQHTGFFIHTFINLEKIKIKKLRILICTSLTCFAIPKSASLTTRPLGSTRMFAPLMSL